LAEFKSGKVKVLIATDIAARGIDVSGVSHVFNFELPNVPDQYVHRIGRTARAGADGIAISYCADDEKPYLRDIERLIRQKITVQPLPENFLAESAKIKSSRGPIPMSRDEQNGRNGRTMQDRNAHHRHNPQGQRGPRANPAGDRRPGDQPRGERPQGERQARPEGQRQTLGASFGGNREGGNGQRPQGDQPRFYGPRKKKFSPRPAGGTGGQRGGAQR
jgi:ATP-dependent RNA helicase RhlE